MIDTLLSKLETRAKGSQVLLLIDEIQHLATSAESEPLAEAFAELDRSPYWMMRLISHLITNNSSTASALAHTLEVLNSSEQLDAIGSRLRPIDRIVFMAIADGQKPFDKTTLELIEQQTDVKGLKSNVQRAIERLTSGHLISKMGRGEYFIEKPGLRKYLQIPGNPL